MSAALDLGGLPELEGLPFEVDDALAEARRQRRILDALSAEDFQTWLDEASDDEVEELRTSFDLWAEPHQIWRPGAGRYSLDSSGRGGGKTWRGAHTVRYLAERPSLLAGGEIGVGGRTANDVRGTLVKAILAAHPRARRPRYYPSYKSIVWPSGVVARLASGEKPEEWRGMNLAFLWADEFAHWKYIDECVEAFDPALRLGIAEMLVTTTPLPVPGFIRFFFRCDEIGTPELDATGNPVPLEGVRVQTVSTDANPHLERSAVASLHGRLDGTRSAEQELHGRLVLVGDNAPWLRADIRRVRPDELPDLVEVVVAVDPAVRQDGKGAETGVVVMGRDVADRLYLLADASGHYRPEDAAEVVSAVYHSHRADRLVVEKNQGGGWISAALRASDRRFEAIEIELVHAEGSKASRAQGVCGKWQRGEVFHVGAFPQLEHQMVTFDMSAPEARQQTDRMDALVHAAAALTGDERASLMRW